MKKAVYETNLAKRFQEKDLRKKTASDMDLAAVTKLLGHVSARTTSPHYRLRGQLVSPHTLKRNEQDELNWVYRCLFSTD